MERDGHFSGVAAREVGLVAERAPRTRMKGTDTIMEVSEGRRGVTQAAASRRGRGHRGARAPASLPCARLGRGRAPGEGTAPRAPVATFWAARATRPSEAIPDLLTPSAGPATEG